MAKFLPTSNKMQARKGFPISIFTPSFADLDNTNAQNLTVKEIVARLPPEWFRVSMISMGEPDPRIAARKNTTLLPYYKHGNAAHLLACSLFSCPDIYFYPRHGLLDRWWFVAKRRFAWSTSLITHVVSSMTDVGERDPMVQAIRQADAVFANSTFVAQTVRQRFSRNAGTIYNGIDSRYFFSRVPCEKSQLNVLFAGSLEPHKRPDLVISAAAGFPQVMFYLAGRGSCEIACRELATQLGCHNVVFLGHLSQARLGEEMRRADIFLFPSIDEGHPQVLGQAAACGLPVIAMNSYHPDYVVNGETGFLLDSDQEIGATLQLLISNSSLRHAMAAAAIRHSRKFDWDRITEQWIAVFMQVTGRDAN
jgi:glycosyltransferase involved in cell wall biosynthesis